MYSTVGIFDSGVGGLSIFSAVAKQLPDLSYVYCSDNSHFPYGPKAESDVLKCVVNATEKLVAKFPLDVLVIACNTASTVVLDSLRQKYKFPIVGVVPAIKPAAKQSRSKVIGILATPATIKGRYIDQLIAEFASDCKVIKVGAAHLAEIAEKKLRNEPYDKAQLAFDLKPLFSEPKLDTVVMGCTHFPLLIDEMKALAPSGIDWIDSARAIASRVETLAKTFARTPNPRRVATFTQGGKSVDSLAPYLQALGFSETIII